MKTRLLATTALALGLLLPAAAMAQQQSGDSPAKPTMENKTSPGSTGTTSGSSGMSSQSGTSSGMSSDTKVPGTAGTTTSTTTRTTTVSTLDKSVIGKTLYGANDEEVGEIDDVVVSQSGGVKSVLIDVGGFLGLGAKTIAVPADDIRMQGEKLVSDTLTKRQAEQMPEYKK